MLVIPTTRTHCRCRRCDTRRVLPRNPDAYVRRQPVCSGCGARDWRMDRWMMTRNTSARGPRALGCVCGGYHHTHRRGSLFCWRRSDGSERYPGDPDFMSRYAEAA